MNRASRLAMVAFAALALVGTSTAHATTVTKMSLKDLALKSNAVVVARVEDQVARYDANKEIYTYVTLRVLDPVKGSRKDDVITIRQLGGVVDNIASIVPGMPTFKKGEEVVVFLSQNDKAGYPWIMGLQQGKYTVSQDQNGTKRVRNELEGTSLIDASGKAFEPGKTADMPLQALLDGVRTNLDEAGKIQIDPTVPNE
ncbi:MAG TPA: hypothetical protein VFM00_06515 [Candidatus Eisenbacteria bacterium]|nr:hypothetical protein [Candidatus Eisenbacteria bacterium]